MSALGPIGDLPISAEDARSRGQTDLLVPVAIELLVTKPRLRRHRLRKEVTIGSHELDEIRLVRTGCSFRIIWCPHAGERRAVRLLAGTVRFSA